MHAYHGVVKIALIIDTQLFRPDRMTDEILDVLGDRQFVGFEDLGKLTFLGHVRMAYFINFSDHPFLVQ